MRTTIATLSAATLLATGVMAGEAAYDKPVTIDLNFIYHIDADMAEQDVYVTRDDPAKVWRASKADQDLAQPVFASARPVEHNPFDPAKNGPYDKGRALGLTLGDWFEAKGSGTYACEDGQAEMDVAFTGLVPGGVYTMWHWFAASPPTDPFNGTYDIPVGSRDGAQSVFTADEDGNAVYRRTFKPCLQLGGEHLDAGLGIAWHSDGKTYGHHVGDPGTVSHVQLFLVLPKRAGL